jgi:hypothetical protein
MPYSSTQENQMVWKTTDLPDANGTDLGIDKMANSSELGIVSQLGTRLLDCIKEAHGRIDTVL